MEAGRLLQFGFLQFLLVQSTQFHWYMIPSNSCFCIFDHLHSLIGIAIASWFSLVIHTKYCFQIYTSNLSVPLLMPFDTYSPFIFLSASKGPGVGRARIYRVVCVPISTLQGKLRWELWFISNKDLHFIETLIFDVSSSFTLDGSLV